MSQISMPAETDENQGFLVPPVSLFRPLYPSSRAEFGGHDRCGKREPNCHENHTSRNDKPLP